VPRENEALNETWIPDRDRFSYQGVYSPDRLLTPMVRTGHDWRATDWETALSQVASDLKRRAASLGALASPSSTLEELYLLNRVMRGLGSSNIDHRLRQLDDRDQDADPAHPSLGMKIADIDRLSALLVVAPWVGFNLSRFRDPVFISTGLGPTLASTDCAQTWSGPLTGYWSLQCAGEVPNRPNADESQSSADAKAFAMRFIRSHESRLLPVVVARVGRGVALFHPIQEIDLDAAETRPLHWALLGLWMYYALSALAIVGAVVLRRRHVPLFPLAGVGLTVVVAMVLAFGNTRYRMPFEVCLVVLAAAAIDRIFPEKVPPGSGESAIRAVTTPSPKSILSR